MSDDSTYKPIRLTSGKRVDYSAILKAKVEMNKETAALRHGPGAELSKLGIRGTTTISYRKDANGNVIKDARGNPVTVSQFTPTEVPSWFTKAIMILSGHEECYFEGCDQIVENYKKELAELEARPGGCRDCERSRLKRKYAQQFQQALPPNEVNKLARPMIPPHRVVNMETNTIEIEPKKPAAFRTISRQVPQAITDAFTKKVNEGKIIVNGQEIQFHGEKLEQQPQLPGSAPGFRTTSDN